MGNTSAGYCGYKEISITFENIQYPCRIYSITRVERECINYFRWLIVTIWSQSILFFIIIGIKLMCKIIKMNVRGKEKELF